MNVLQNFSLKDYNTFGIDAKAKNFIEVTDESVLPFIAKKYDDLFILGGGSNMLLTSDIDKTVVFINTKGIQAKDLNENEVLVSVKAGENWHEFVLWCIAQNYGGVENLSLIPGNAGTCPIQNIGAYGFEVKDTIQEVTVFEIESGKTKVFSNAACEFGYRNSIFKNEAKGKYIITEVSFKLTRQHHKTDISYGAIQAELNGNTNPTLKEISDAVINIRNSKLPNPKEIGNSGSFFKNPVISKVHYEKIVMNYNDVPSYPISDTTVKVPAGWLIETAGFKGKSFGNAGVHEKQALVLVNYGNATGKEVYEVATTIQEKIKELFEIDLEIEVNVI